MTLIDSKHKYGEREHLHQKLSDIRSNAYAQMLGKSYSVSDDKVVAAARKKIKKEGKSSSLLLQLASALCLQFRYREAIEICEKVLENERENYSAKRMLAIRYMSTGQIDKSLKMFLSLKEESRDMLDIAYRIALCYFYKGEYVAAKNEFYKAFDFCKDNPEMFIAVLYWYLFCLVMLKEDINEALRLYRPMDVGHHVGYDYALRVFLGEPSSKFEELSKADNLTRIMYLVGLYFYYVFKGESELAEKTFNEALCCDEYWSSFSGLAVWYLKIKEK